MKAIVAVDKNWGIGKNGELLAHLSGDLKYFKERTLGKVVIMGRKTFESLPGKKPLKGRTNIVLTEDKKFDADCVVCGSIEILKNKLNKYDDEDIFIIGGAKVYEQFLPYCDTYYVTKIDESFPADRYIENLDENKNFYKYWESELQSENEIKYKFVEYRRK
ncbi:dihydrofolate reductase [Anaerovorax odorimutans]|uniref:dihydrofolate reductase n=1 Tax=Anaerovorax odorimutans TaxID=109327 RepID=UPI000421E1B6|nr:dihydrofolate reductase [Anaerovorax odorimutans]